jgi:hypothetical protein
MTEGTIRNALVLFSQPAGLVLAGAVTHIQLPMSFETLQIALAVTGGVVAFLLGKELARGFVQWRAQRIAAAERRDDQQPRN